MWCKQAPGPRVRALSRWERPMIVIDGSFGEGGGQILRSSLTLSMLTGTPFRIESIRARRRKPGLLRQHLTAVHAAARVCGASVDGAEPGSRELRFEPGPVNAGVYAFDTQTAGSACLVLQTLLPALLRAPGPSTVTISGGTHNPMAPSFDFLHDVFGPVLQRMGAHVRLTLARHGFYPAGGGTIVADIQPGGGLTPVELVDRGAMRSVHLDARVANLPIGICEREVGAARAILKGYKPTDEVASVDAAGPGNVCIITTAFEHITEQFTGFGAKGVPAEDVAMKCAREARRYLTKTAPVGQYLADQLLIPLYLAGGGRFRCLTPTEHARTNAAVIEMFTGARFALTKINDREWETAWEG